MPKKKVAKVKKLSTDISSGDVVKMSSEKVINLLSGEGVTRQLICMRLFELLGANKPIVADGEIISYEPDNGSRLKAVELVLDVLGERRLQVPQGDMHIHFTNILQLIEAYERGDSDAIKAAGKFIDASNVTGATS